jgi:urea transporter
MEFDEIKKIWNSQDNEAFYGFNEQALHHRISAKKRQANQMSSFTELLVIMAYVVAAIVIFGVNFFTAKASIIMYVLCAWMMASAAYVIMHRVKRMKEKKRFDRSMHGDLQHAIAMASYQINLSQLVRWNTFPVALLIVLGLWESEKSIWAIAGMVVFFALTLYASGWELNIYKRRKQELEVLQQKLESQE